MPSKCACGCGEKITWAGDFLPECAQILWPDLLKGTQEYIDKVQPGQHKYDHLIKDFNLSKSTKTYTIHEIQFLANNMQEGEDTFENADGDWIFCGTHRRLSGLLSKVGTYRRTSAAYGAAYRDEHRDEIKEKQTAIRKRKRDIRTANAAEYLRAHGEGHVLNAAEVDAVVEDCKAVLREKVFGGNEPSAETVEEPPYTGMTGMDDVNDESYRWGTERGNMKSDGTFTGSKNRPPLVKRDGNHPTMKEMREEYGFETTILWEDTYYFNAHRVEYALQHWLKEELGLQLGQRLHRVSGAGGFGLSKKWDLEFFGQLTVNVFVTSSPKLPELLRTGELLINHFTRVN